MAGIHFSFEDFKQLLALNMGIADRLDENRAESFTVLYCNLRDVDQEIIESSLREILEDIAFIIPFYILNLLSKPI